MNAEIADSRDSKSKEHPKKLARISEESLMQKFSPVDQNCFELFESISNIPKERQSYFGKMFED